GSGRAGPGRVPGRDDPQGRGQGRAVKPEGLDGLDDLRGELARRAPGAWELYRKSARSRELDTTPRLRRRSIRHEEGWAARWSERGSLRFAAASSAPALRRALDEAAAIPAAPEEPPDWPHRSAVAPQAAAAAPPDEPPEIFEAFTNALSSASRGE